MKNSRSVEKEVSEFENLSGELPEEFIEYAENGDTGPLATAVAIIAEEGCSWSGWSRGELHFLLDKMTDGEGIEFKAPRSSLQNIVRELVTQRRNAARPDPEESDEVEWYLRQKKDWIPVEESRRRGSVEESMSGDQE